MIFRTKQPVKEPLDFSQNALHTVRLLAAFSVMHYHGRMHLQTQAIPVLGEILYYFLGVPLFFALSGFLLWHSAGRENTFVAYARKRFRRIFPELWMAVAVELVVLLLLFQGSVKWLQLGLFALTQSTILQFWTPDFLRGYGCGTPNGSLWSICTTIQFYVVLYYLYRILHGRKLMVWLLFIVGSILIGISGPLLEGVMPVLVYKLYQQTLFPYLWLFAAGMFLSEKWESVIPFLCRWWWAFFALSLAARWLRWDLMSGYYGVIDNFTLILAVFALAYRFPRFGIKTDISYGIYLYHMTVFNAMIELGLTGNRAYLLLGMGLSCVLAWGSTKIINRSKTKNSEQKKRE